MKRMLGGLLVVLMMFAAICSIGFAEGTNASQTDNEIGLAEWIDVSQMNYDELVALKTAVEAELRNRPEASPFILSSGVYAVGVDIKPGWYYVATAAMERASLNVFSTKETYEQRWIVGGNGGAIINCSLNIGEQAEHIELVEGNYVDIRSAPIEFSIFESEEADYNK